MDRDRQTDVVEEVFALRGADGVELFVRRWGPVGEARGVVQVVHGLGDHSGRYERFGRFLAGRGFAVYAMDQRGHGRTRGAGDAETQVLDGGAGTFEAMLDDLHRLMERARGEWPGAPAILFAHSFGSLLAQRHMEKWGQELAGVVLSGTFGRIPVVEVTVCLADALATGPFARWRSPLFGAMFWRFRRAFGRPRTRCDWLTRDSAEAERAARDPLLGRRPTNALAADLLRGLERTWEPGNEGRVPKGLPVLVISGSEDPTTERTGASTALVERYRAGGMTRVEHRIYAGGRHELLNEVNREEVMGEVGRWMEGVVGSGGRCLDSAGGRLGFG